MPINSIIQEPGSASVPTILPAYRPVLFRVTATRTDGAAVPPVVYCDIYFNEQFYKSIPATQYAKANAGDSEWQFDISDACQEFLRRDLPLNGGSVLVRGEKQVAAVYCRFRATGFDANGFITAEGIDPVQGTGLNASKGGSGTQSETFLVINSALQHEANPDFLQHLTFFRHGTFNADAYPLTHRPARYHLGRNDSDYYPFLFMGSNPIAKICVRYKLKGSSSFIETCYNAPQTCDSAVTDVDTTLLTGSATKVAFASTGGATQFDYRVDNLSWKTTPSNPFTITFNDLLLYLITELTGEPIVTDDNGQILVPEEVNIYDVDHFIEIRPRCANGAYGTIGNNNFTVPSAQTCNPPTLFELASTADTEYLFNIELPDGKTDFELQWRFDYGGNVLTPVVSESYTLASPFHWTIPANFRDKTGTFRIRIRTKCGPASFSQLTEEISIPYTPPVQEVTVHLDSVSNNGEGGYDIDITLSQAVADDLTCTGFFAADRTGGSIGTYGFEVVIPAGQTAGFGTVGTRAPAGGTAVMSRSKISRVTPNPTSDGKTIKIIA